MLTEKSSYLININRLFTFVCCYVGKDSDGILKMFVEIWKQLKFLKLLSVMSIIYL